MSSKDEVEISGQMVFNIIRHSIGQATLLNDKDVAVCGILHISSKNNILCDPRLEVSYDYDYFGLPSNKYVLNCENETLYCFEEVIEEVCEIR